MPKARLLVAAIIILLACGATPAGAMVVLDAAPQFVADQTAAPEAGLADDAPGVSLGIAGWAVGFAALGVAGMVLRRRSPGRIVSN